nr:AAC_HP1_G0006480.mRNA.1.CDS.1 [Saccharomyces cerevisiae]
MTLRKEPTRPLCNAGGSWNRSLRETTLRRSWKRYIRAMVREQMLGQGSMAGSGDEPDSKRRKITTQHKGSYSLLKEIERDAT